MLEAEEDIDSDTNWEGQGRVGPEVGQHIHFDVIILVLQCGCDLVDMVEQIKGGVHRY